MVSIVVAAVFDFGVSKAAGRTLVYESGCSGTCFTLLEMALVGCLLSTSNSHIAQYYLTVEISDILLSSQSGKDSISLSVLRVAMLSSHALRSREYHFATLK